jgi:hypothetical protein
MPRRKLTEEEKAANKKKREYDRNLKRLTGNLQSDRERFIRKCREGKFPDPPESRVYAVGDRVKTGAIEWTRVLEVLEDGKVYKLLRIHPQTPYGKYTGHSFEITYQRWTELLPYRTTEEIIAVPRVEEDEDIRFSYSQRHVISLLWTYYSSGIDLDQDYQRGNVWTGKQKYMLIESIYRNIDIGKFTIIRRSFKDEKSRYYEMLDGKQRLTALKEFYESRFMYRGRYYHELHGRDQAHFDNYAISYGETEPLTDEQKYRYFLKLNTSGTPQDPEHIKKVEQMWIHERVKNDTSD